MQLIGSPYVGGMGDHCTNPKWDRPNQWPINDEHDAIKADLHAISLFFWLVYLLLPSTREKLQGGFLDLFNLLFWQFSVYFRAKIQKKIPKDPFKPGGIPFFVVLFLNETSPL